MICRLIRLACLMLLGAATSLTAMADSLTSSASSAGSASVGSLSDSVRGSSTSSSGDKKVAEGEYRVTDVAALPDRPDMLRMQMQMQMQMQTGADASAGDAGAPAFSLDLPRQALGQRGLAAGALVRVLHRPYGLEFAHAPTREAFFLVLADDWRSDLDARAVTF